MPVKGQVILDPTEYIDIINTIENARARVYDDPDIFDGLHKREYSPRSMARRYGTTERNIVRAMRKGVDHYERVIRRRVGRMFPSAELRPASLSDVDFDFLMYEMAEWLDDRGSYKDFFTSPVVRRRCPAIAAFRSLTQFRECFRAWRDECQAHGVHLSKSKAMAKELYRS